MLRSAGIMGVATAASRALGFVRDVLIAAIYGTSATAQAFVVAFRIPNLLRDLSGEGAANSAFVPVFSRTRALEGKRAWAALAQVVWSQVFVGFILISILGVIAAPWLVALAAPGFHGDPELRALTIRLTRILFPFIGLVGLAAFFMGLLNSIHHFTLPSMGPVILNLCMIGGIFLWRPDALGLCWGVIAGGVLQLVVQVPLLRKIGVSFRFRFKSHPGVRQIRRLLFPRLIGTGVYQLSVLVDSIYASFSRLVGPGGIASLYFAHRFLQLPMALFGISMAQAALPTLSRQAAADDLQAMKETCLLALKSSLLIAIPASVGLVFLGRPIIQTLLERGAFSSEATATTVRTLQWYALGLSSMCAVKVLANTLYALHDTWTPVRSAAAALMANIILNFLLVWPMKLPGLALATSLSSTLNGLHLYRTLRRRIGFFEAGLRGWTFRVLAASVGMGLFAQGAWILGLRTVVPLGSWAAIPWLLIAVACGVVGFFGLGFFLRIEEVRQVVAWFWAKGRAFKRN